MKNKYFNKNKTGESFQFSVFIVFLSIAISLFAFISEENKITGFVVGADLTAAFIQPVLIEFKDVDSLKTLVAGNYYVDSNGIVYWVDDESMPAIAKVDFIDESQKNQHIYIDNEGRIGYLLSPISINNNQKR